MGENTDALRIPDRFESQSTKIASLLEAVPPQYRQEFGSGSLLVGDCIEIKGEGEERKLHVVINITDPEYEEYRSGASEATKQGMRWIKKERNDLREQLDQTIKNVFLQKRANILAKDGDPYQERHAEYAKKLEHSMQQEANSEISIMSQTITDVNLDLINSRKQQLKELSALKKITRTIAQQEHALMGKNKASFSKKLSTTDKESEIINPEVERFVVLGNFIRTLCRNGAIKVTIQEPQNK